MHALHMDPRAFGTAAAETVKANYRTLEDAQRQGAANLASGKNTPWYITDETGDIVYDYRDLSKDEKAALVQTHKTESQTHRVAKLTAVA